MESSSGFTDKLSSAVVKRSRYIFNLYYIVNNFPVFKFNHAVEILYMMDVFGDIDETDFPLKDNCDYKDELDFNFDLEYGGYYYFNSSSDDSEVSDMSGVEYSVDD